MASPPTPLVVGPSTLLARIQSEVCQVRCFASNLSPVYEGELVEGTVVQVGEEVGEYRRVLLPLGVIGYVSKRFTTEPEQGQLATNRPMVSFRYRPTPKNRAEAPVQTLPNGTTLSYLGEVDDWWRVRFVTTSAFVPIKEIEVFAEPTEALRKGYAALGRVHETEWRDAVASYEAAVKLASDRARRTGELAALQAAYAEEVQKQPLREQNLKPIRTKLQVLMADLPKGSPLRANAQILESSIRNQQVFIDAAVVLNTEKPAAPPPRIKITPTPEDKLAAKLHTIGWLSYHPGAPGPAAFRLEKGGRVISYLYCKNLRYDLSMFKGVEIGVRGVRRRDASVPYLEVQKIEVLGHLRR